MSKGQQQIFFTKLTDVRTSSEGPAEVLGRGRWDGEKYYKYVQYSGGAGAVAAVVGNLVGYTADGGSNMTVVNGDTSAIAAASPPAGMLISAPAINGYCWIQAKGLATLGQAIASGADGSLFKLHSTDGQGTIYVETDLVLEAGVCLDSATNLVYLDCPF